VNPGFGNFDPLGIDLDKLARNRKGNEKVQGANGFLINRTPNTDLR
jgi:hypothetical protein